MSNHTEKYKPHNHKAVNINDLHNYEHETAGFNKKLAVGLTKATGTMVCAYVFMGLAILGFPALSAWLGPMTALYVTWISQTFIQLCMLPILSVGQSVIGRKAELQADEQYSSTLKTFKDAETLIEQNNKQFEMLEAQNKVLEAHYQELLRQTAMLNTALTPRRRPMKQVEGKD